MGPLNSWGPLFLSAFGQGWCLSSSPPSCEGSVLRSTGFFMTTAFISILLMSSSSRIKDHPTTNTKQQNECYIDKHPNNATPNVHTPCIKWMIKVFGQGWCLSSSFLPREWILLSLILHSKWRHTSTHLQGFHGF